MFGKRVRGSTYFHRTTVPDLPVPLSDRLDRVLRGIGEVPDWNVVRFDSDASIGLLLYEDFETSAFPSLIHSTRIRAEDLRQVARNFAASTNPPILHRKELLVAPCHPLLADWKRLTDVVEDLGLFVDLHSIGHRREWEARLNIKGYEVVGPCLKRT